MHHLAQVHPSLGILAVATPAAARGVTSSTVGPTALRVVQTQNSEAGDRQFHDSLEATVAMLPKEGGAKHETHEDTEQKPLGDAAPVKPAMQAPVTIPTKKLIVAKPQVEAAPADAAPNVKPKSVAAKGDVVDQASAPSDPVKIDVSVDAVVPVAMQPQPEPLVQPAGGAIVSEKPRVVSHAVAAGAPRAARKVDAPVTATPVAGVGTAVIVAVSSGAVRADVDHVAPPSQMPPMPVAHVHAPDSELGHGLGVKAASVAAPLVDASMPSSDLKTMVATPNVLEVGVASGSHGWLRVRAEFGQAGEVGASVVAASAAAAEGLHKELPAISAYLAGERVGVSSLVVNAADKGAGTQEALVGTGVGTQTSAGSGGSPRGKEAGAQTVGTRYDTSAEVDAGVGLLGMSVPAAVFTNGNGSWLSVRV